MRDHDPYRHAGSRRYDVPQLSGPVEDAPVAGRPVNVFALVDRYPPQCNAGGEWMLHNLLVPLVEAGHTVDVATAVADPYDLDGVTVWPRGEIPNLAGQCDVMVGHLMWTREAVETAARYRRPLVYLAHNHRQLAHWSLLPLNVTVLVVNSVWLAEWVDTPRRRGLPQSAAHGVATWDGPSVVIRPPVRTAAYELDRDPADAEYVTMVNMTEEKGAPLFYRLSDMPPARRWLAVEGGYGNQVLPGRNHPAVEWQPQTPRIRDDVYARTRVQLVPSEYESWGLVACEALASGIPVIAAPTNGLREALGDGATFVDAHDLAGWHAALGALDDPDRYAEASDRARKRSAELDGQAVADLATWEQTIRAAAVAGGVLSATPANQDHRSAP